MIVAVEYEKILLNKFLCISARLDILSIKNANKQITKVAPINPHSSPTAENI
tara:strand:+ start:174 stop:329 length:156 start_codon:yes stop_codon:yes gene_type:complete